MHQPGWKLFDAEYKSRLQVGQVLRPQQFSGGKGSNTFTGYHTNGPDNNRFVVRYNADGSLDMIFGTNGLYCKDSI